MTYAVQVNGVLKGYRGERQLDGNGHIHIKLTGPWLKPPSMEISMVLLRGREITVPSGTRLNASRFPAKIWRSTAISGDSKLFPLMKNLSPLCA